MKTNCSTDTGAACPTFSIVDARLSHISAAGSGNSTIGTSGKTVDAPRSAVEGGTDKKRGE